METISHTNYYSNQTILRRLKTCLRELQYGGYAGLIVKVTTGSCLSFAPHDSLEEMVSLSVSGAGFLFYPRRGEKKIRV